MKWLPHSIRWRIQAWHGLLLLLVLACFGVTAYHLQRNNELRHLDGELQLRLSALNASMVRQHPDEGRPPPPRDMAADLLGLPDFPPDDRRPGPEEFRMAPEFTGLFGGGDGFYYRLWTRRNEVLGMSPNAPRDVTMPVRNQGAPGQRSRDGMRENFAFTPPGECLLVGVSETGVDGEMARFAGWLAVIGGVVLSLGLLGGWWLASAAIAPISRISAAAARLAAGHLDERIPVAETDSELGQLAVLLNDAFTRLDAAFTEQARFTSDAAHELRTPVAVILAQTQLALARAHTSEADLKTIQITRRAAERMQNLIESLLSLAKLDAGSESFEPCACDLAELGRDNLEQIRPLADERGITVRGDLAPASCRADPDHVAQIVTNLLANAVKYSRPGDEVSLTTGRENGHALVTVSDTGPGIAAEHLPHLFERFYRADASRNRGTGGAGLGLAICKSLAEAQGGRLEVRSAPGKGCTFTLWLPCHLS